MKSSRILSIKKLGKFTRNEHLKEEIFTHEAEALILDFNETTPKWNVRYFYKNDYIFINFKNKAASIWEKNVYEIPMCDIQGLLNWSVKFMGEK